MTTQHRRYVGPCELNYPPANDQCHQRGAEYWRGLNVCQRCKTIAELDRAVSAEAGA